MLSKKRIEKYKAEIKAARKKILKERADKDKDDKMKRLSEDNTQETDKQLNEL